MAVVGDDRVVIRDLAVVEDPLVRLDIAFVERLGRILGKLPVRLGLEDPGDNVVIVFRQVAAVGPRVGQHLVAFVEGLGDGQGLLGRNAEAGVGLALQRGQVEELGRALRRFLACFLDRRRLAGAGGDNGLGLFFLPDPVGAFVPVIFLPDKMRVDPFALIAVLVVGKGGEQG